jgi:hypothetical protein
MAYLIKDKSIMNKLQDEIDENMKSSGAASLEEFSTM